MKKVCMYTDGCAKPDGSSGLGCVIHFTEASQILLYSQNLSLSGNHGQRAYNAEKEAALFAKRQLTNFQIDRQIIIPEESITLLSDCIRLVGALVKSNNHPYTTEHRKREKEFMPLADSLAALGAQGIEIKGHVATFKDHEPSQYLRQITLQNYANIAPK